VNMGFSKRTVLAAVVTTIAVILVVTVGVGIGIVKLWPVARTWIQSGLGARASDAARGVVAEVGARLGDDRIAQLSRTGAGAAALGALAENQELAAVLKWTSAIPALGPLVQNGAYQKALEEAVRQNVPSIAQVRLEQVASPEARALLAEVQQVLARDTQAATAASTVNPDVINLLKSETFARLRQYSISSPFLSGSAPAKEAE
jgi:hypothetical protein